MDAEKMDKRQLVLAEGEVASWLSRTRIEMAPSESRPDKYRDENQDGEGSGESEDAGDAETELLLPPTLLQEKRAAQNEGSTGKGAFGLNLGPGNSGEHERQYVSLLYCVAYVVSNVIGSGIFVTPGEALEEAGSVGAALSLWVLGAFVPICSCLISAELGTSFPDQLGDARFLQEAFGDSVSLSFIWLNLVTLNGVGLALQTMVFAEYLVPYSPMGQKYAAVGCVVFFTIVNLSGIAFEEKVQMGVSTLRGVLVALMVASAGVSLRRNSSIASSNFLDRSFRGTKPKGLGFGLISVLFAYNGAGAVVSLAPLMKNPNRQLPMALGIGMTIVMVTYMLLNLSYLCVLSAPDLAHSKVVAIDTAKHAFGDHASIAIGVLIAASVAGSFQSWLSIGALALQGAARHRKIPSWCGRGKDRPAAALLYECISCIVFILLPKSNVENLIQVTGVVLSAFGILFGMAAIKLRFDHPFHKRRAFPSDDDGATRGFQGEGEKDGHTVLRRLEPSQEECGGGNEGGSPFKMPFFPLEPMAVIIVSTVLVAMSSMKYPIATVVFVLLAVLPYPTHRLLQHVGWLK